MKTLREIIFSDEFDEFYESLAPRIREKYDYALDIVRTQYVLNKKFVKNLESSIFYELRMSNCLFYKYLIFIYFYQIMNF